MPPHVALRTVAVLGALVAAAGEPAAQAPQPREISVGDLIQGYVADVGGPVVTTGHLAYVGDRVLLTPNQPSAMVPAVVDMSRLPPAVLAEVKARCAAVRTTFGGCQAKLQARVQPLDGRPGLIADHIEILAASR